MSDQTVPQTGGEHIAPIVTKERPGGNFLADVLAGNTSGVQHLYRFANGYGASQIRGWGTHGAAEGRWELAVIRWTGDGFDLVYDTPVADDVIGWLSEEDVQEKLRAIRALPAPQAEAGAGAAA